MRAWSPNLQKIRFGRSRRRKICLRSQHGSTTRLPHHRQPHQDPPRHHAEEAAEAADEEEEEAEENLGAASEGDVPCSWPCLPSEGAVYGVTTLMRFANEGVRALWDLQRGFLNGGLGATSAGEPPTCNIPG